MREACVSTKIRFAVERATFWVLFLVQALLLGSSSNTNRALVLIGSVAGAGGKLTICIERLALLLRLVHSISIQDVGPIWVVHIWEAFLLICLAEDWASTLFLALAPLLATSRVITIILELSVTRTEARSGTLLDWQGVLVDVTIGIILSWVAFSLPSLTGDWTLGVCGGRNTLNIRWIPFGSSTNEARCLESACRAGALRCLCDTRLGASPVDRTAIAVVAGAVAIHLRLDAWALLVFGLAPEIL